jgi:LysM repeat protein
VKGAATRYGAVALLATVVFLSGVGRVEAQRRDAYVHVVRQGETLASIAQRYYGDPKRESVLVAENGLTALGGAAIVTGMRLVIPWVSYHRVQEGESWNELATRFYGEARRAFVLVHANGGKAGEQPDEGAELLIPYPLRHVAEQGDNLRRVARFYYDDAREERKLRRFNGIRGRRLTRGQILLVPLADLTLSEEGRRIIEETTGQKPETGAVRELQARIDEQLPALQRFIARGHYTEAVALGNRLLGAGSLTGNQIVTIQRRLGTAYVALGRHDLAVESFSAALERQPDLELDAMRHSPTVLRAFRQAKRGGSGKAPVPKDAPSADEPDEPDAPEAE